MGILARIEQRATIEDPSVPLSSASAMLMDAWGGTKTEAGVAVTPQKSLALPAAWSCINNIAGAVGSSACHVYERLEPRGKRRAAEHELYWRLHDAPNDQIDSLIFFETLTAHLLTWGNAYSEIEFDGAGRIIGLWPLLPDRTRAERRDGKKVYVTRVRERKDGAEKEVTLPAQKVLHVAGLGFDGLRGYSPIGVLKQSLSIGMAAEQFAAKFYGSGLNPGTVLMHPQRLSDEAQARIRATMEEQSGLSRAMRVLVLEEGLKLEKLGIPPDEAQFLESRLFQVRDIGRIYNMPPYLLGDAEKGASYASIEAQGIDYVRHTLRRWFVRWERAMNLQLVGDRRYFVEFLIDALLRGDLPSRMAAYATGRQWGLYSYNHVAEIENWDPDPTPYGDMKLVPLNMVPSGMLEQIAAAQAKGADVGDGGGDAKALDAARAERMEAVIGQVRRVYVGLLRDAAGRVVRREVKALRAKLAAAKGDLAAFVADAEAYYSGPMRQEAVRDYLAPVDALARFLLEEFRGIYGETRTDAGAAAAAVTEALVSRLIDRSRGDLSRLIDRERGDLAATGAGFGEWAVQGDENAGGIQIDVMCAELIDRFKKEQ